MRARVLVTFLLAVAVALGLVAALRLPGPTPVTVPTAPPTARPAPGTTPHGSGQDTTAALLLGGDGAGVSTPAPQPPDLYPVTRLAPGETPPQFVVVSFDGACNNTLWKHYLDLADVTGSRFTFFLSGLCLVPDRQHLLYRPPHKPVGTSAIGFGSAALIPQRIRDIARAYGAGNEIGTHFLGHFCDAAGVGTWSSADWASELDQARGFLDRWAEVNGSTDPSLVLPFDSSTWKGERTPCLAGRPSQMYPVFAKAGFTYDASRAGTLVWPRKVTGYDLWGFPLQRIKVVGYGRTNLSMDYNLLFAQNGGRITAPPATCARIQASTYESLMQALRAVETTNRAPFFVGNHFNDWVCDAYRNSLTSFVTDAHTRYPDIRFVTFEYLARWLDAQDPAVLASWQRRAAPKY